MEWALVILRVAVGLTLSAHGAQKLFGWFGGPGVAKMEQGLRAQGYKPARAWAWLAILGELGGGLSLAFGFLTPLGAAGAVGAMVMAVHMHWAKGFFGAKGGFEYPLTLLVTALALGISGAGTYSLDALFNIRWPEALIFGVLTVAAVIVDAVGIALVRSAPQAQQHATPNSEVRPA